ncbi:MAG TPA: heme o synthase [Candidatus Saccharimonadales bacterium]|nr:heme o synthase [Candidatus Saccharimonadales bacterium]
MVKATAPKLSEEASKAERRSLLRVRLLWRGSDSFGAVVKTYYQLTKPGIIYGNILTALAGFLLASSWHGRWWRLLALLIGTSLVIGGACVFNNYIDRGIDQKMKRTQKRALVSGVVTGTQALIYASVLCVVGFAVLVAFTNFVTVCVGVIGLLDYVVLYGVSKRRSTYGTLVGSISGAMPVVAGYTAVTGHFDLGAGILFLIMAAWQMPHFFAIALYRQDDYAAAGLPVLPIAKGERTTRLQMVLYTAAFWLANVALTAFGYAGYSYAAVMTLVSAAWLVLGLQGFGAPDLKRWARQMFFFSLFVVLILSLMLAIGSIIP